jgi:hypothetical protein
MPPPNEEFFTHFSRSPLGHRLPIAAVLADETR